MREKLTEAQRATLEEWSGVDVGMGFHFKDLAKRTKRPVTAFAPVVRGLASLGLLSFERGCFTENGEVYGSAYVLTEAGRAALNSTNPIRG